jgi:hypothetical protein
VTFCVLSQSFGLPAAVAGSISFATFLRVPSDSNRTVPGETVSSLVVVGTTIENALAISGAEGISVVLAGLDFERGRPFAASTLFRSNYGLSKPKERIAYQSRENRSRLADLFSGNDHRFESKLTTARSHIVLTRWRRHRQCSSACLAVHPKGMASVRGMILSSNPWNTSTARSGRAWGWRRSCGQRREHRAAKQIL